MNLYDPTARVADDFAAACHLSMMREIPVREAADILAPEPRSTALFDHDVLYPSRTVSDVVRGSSFSGEKSWVVGMSPSGSEVRLSIAKTGALAVTGVSGSGRSMVLRSMADQLSVARSAVVRLNSARTWADEDFVHQFVALMDDADRE